MGLAERLERYEVTTLPPSSGASLKLVWDSATDDEAEHDGDSPQPIGVALLDAYRITRVPHRAAG